jgi:hypothetical protein
MSGEKLIYRFRYGKRDASRPSSDVIRVIAMWIVELACLMKAGAGY